MSELIKTVGPERDEQDALRAHLQPLIQRAIQAQAATWETDFDAGPGEVVSVSDASHVAADFVVAAGWRLSAPYHAVWGADVDSPAKPTLSTLERLAKHLCGRYDANHLTWETADKDDRWHWRHEASLALDAWGTDL